MLLTTAATIEDGNWHHVGYTYASGAMIGDIKFYIDGVTVTSDGGNNDATKNNALNTINAPVNLATRNGNNSKWFAGGGIDDLRIYNVALTDAQMLAVYNENVSTASTKDFENISSSIYPNPVSNTLNISSSVETKTYKILNTLGATIKVSPATGSMDVSDLKSGLYFLVTDSGMAKFLKK
ncbi:T9SS type A sorting domain-containing protein [Polaribacter sp.]|nr:T9SS type A sorting domain-containing protein [Polaribacter sp.]